ncbi:group III truncated hemoglobin [Arthrobacter sp. TWP1-1]|uniref:group III truncated hemoglobin n=1 Tax=Arthrobacter sp. TWP1-1 TaxID=2804568 RepID=UPI003CE94800
MAVPQQDQRRDLENREDVLLLVETFYTRAFADDLIGPIFTEVVHMDLAAHMPIMADFWQTVLFKAGLYKRNALAVHFEIHAKEPLTLAHFNRWLQLWTLTVDSLFHGEKAELAKVQAHQIGGSMHRRVTGKSASAYDTISLRPDAGTAEQS